MLNFCLFLTCFNIKAHIKIFSRIVQTLGISKFFLIIQSLDTYVVISYLIAFIYLFALKISSRIFQKFQNFSCILEYITPFPRKELVKTHSLHQDLLIIKVTRTHEHQSHQFLQKD